MTTPGLQSHAANVHMPYAVTHLPQWAQFKIELKYRFLGKEKQYDL